MKTMMELQDRLNEAVMQKLGWHWSDEENGIVDENGNFIGWEDFDSIPISSIEYDGYEYTQVNVWGDGTIEFQDEDGESINWGEFTEDFIIEIIKKLKI